MNKELIDIITTADSETLLKIAIQMQKENERKVNELLEKVKELK